MRAAIRATLFVAGLAAAMACARGGEVLPLAKVEGWAPSAQAAFAGDQPAAVAEIVADRAAAEEVWRDLGADRLDQRSGEPREPGIYGDLEDVDFESQALVVWSAGQSGTCPAWLAGLSVEGDAVHIDTGEHAPGAGCTDDYNPYAMLVAVPRSRLPEASLLPTADVVVDGRSHGRESVVDLYPATGWPAGPRR